MKNKGILFGAILAVILTITASFRSEDSSPISQSASCNLEFIVVNDSTYVVNNYTGSFVVENKVLTGSPQVTVSNDTVYISGSDYGIVIMASDSNSCFAHQTINKY